MIQSKAAGGLSGQPASNRAPKAGNGGSIVSAESERMEHLFEGRLGDKGCSTSAAAAARAVPHHPRIIKIPAELDGREVPGHIQVRRHELDTPQSYRGSATRRTGGRPGGAACTRGTPGDHGTRTDGGHVL